MYTGGAMRVELVSFGESNGLDSRLPWAGIGEEKIFLEFFWEKGWWKTDIFLY